LRRAHRGLRVVIGFRNVSLQLGNLRLEVVDLRLDRLQIGASCEGNYACRGDGSF
jgi:hypothetical protein